MKYFIILCLAFLFISCEDKQSEKKKSQNAIQTESKKIDKQEKKRNQKNQKENFHC